MRITVAALNAAHGGHASLLLLCATGVFACRDVRCAPGSNGRASGVPDAPTPVEKAQLATADPFRIFWSDQHNAVLDRAAARFARDIAALNSAPQTRAPGPALATACEDAPEHRQTVDTDESHSLTIAPTGATLAAKTPVGVLRGLATLRQIMFSAFSDTSLQTLTITNAPRFRWRGIMIDTARHFMLVEIRANALFTKSSQINQGLAAASGQRTAQNVRFAKQIFPGGKL